MGSSAAAPHLLVRVRELLSEGRLRNRLALRRSRLLLCLGLVRLDIGVRFPGRRRLARRLARQGSKSEQQAIVGDGVALGAKWQGHKREQDSQWAPNSGRLSRRESQWGAARAPTFLFLPIFWFSVRCHVKEATPDPPWSHLSTFGQSFMWKIDF